MTTEYRFEGRSATCGTAFSVPGPRRKSIPRICAKAFSLFYTLDSGLTRPETTADIRGFDAMRQGYTHRMFWGIVLIAFGAGFLLNRLGIINMDLGEMIGAFWPVFVIMFGLQGLLLQRRSGSWWNLLLIVIGIYFLMFNLGLVFMSPGEFMTLLIPVGIIVAGLCMITRGTRSPKREPPPPNGWKTVEPPSPPHMSPPPSWEPPNPYGSEPGRGPGVNPNGSAGTAPHGPEGAMRGGQAGGGPGGPADAGSGGPMGAMPGGPGIGGPGMSMGAMPGAPSGAAEQAGGNAGGEVPPPPGDAPGRRGWRPFGPGSEWNRPHDDGPYEQEHSRFIGDTYIGNDYWELRPMNVSHFIGDTVLDLTKAHIPVGETKIHVSSFIGDVKVFLPGDPSVGVQVTSSCLIGSVTVMGRNEGGFFNQMTVETPGYHDVPKKIALVVSAFIGDVRVTRVG